MGKRFLGLAVRFVVLFLLLVSLRTVNEGRVWAVMMGQPWLTVLTALALPLMVALAVGLYKWHTLKPAGVHQRLEQSEKL